VPNYDLPNPAPEPLRRVQLFVNSIDRENGHEWLPAWLEEHDVPVAATARATELREALRRLLHVNNVGGDARDAIRVVDRTAQTSVVVELRESGVALSGKDALGEVTAVALTAMLDGTWPRLKVCRNCEWAFYDNSKNRAGSWCSMQLCGNRKKTRAYRARRRAAA
jgi:predicted RNA-binding Zn ribbon-like protein